VSVGELWTLVKGDEVVGEILVDDHDFPWFFGRFTAAPGFAEVRHLFEAEATLSGLMQDDDSVYPAWEAAYLQIRAAVELCGPSGTPVAEFLLHIDGEHVGFRWTDEPFSAEAAAD
jgi:hypothetical protein